MSEIKLLTVGEIARQLNCPLHRVLYLIQSRQIKPLQRAGHLRIFGSDVVEALREELSSNKTGPGVASGAGA